MWEDGDVGGIHVVQDSDQWWAVKNMVMNPRFHKKWEIWVAAWLLAPQVLYTPCSYCTCSVYNILQYLLVLCNV